ncbi:MAG TPA: pyridoxal-phosphate dependent enzyme [Gemmatimonadales bacterium]|nr:pyridoxal-phosphate dependent enzyme [Gemmatimonadales bacterium]
MKGLEALDTADFDRKIRAAFRPCCLGTWPTPLERHPVLSARTGVPELWVKREDRSSAVYGGNKVRGLEFLLRDLRPGDAVVTIGGWGSTHCLATARHARALGARTVLAQFPQGQSDTAERTSRASGEVSTRVFAARTWLGFPAAWVEAWRTAGSLGRRLYIPGGGATAHAVLGHMLAVMEMATQLQGPPDAIVTALGSGGTTAGILLGCSLLGWPTRVVAVRVAPRVVANRWKVQMLARRALRLIRARDVPPPHTPTPPRLLVVDGIGSGYGVPSVAGERARGWGAESGLEVDSTYSGKALAMLPEVARMGCTRVVYWHTYAAPGSVQ